MNTKISNKTASKLFIDFIYSRGCRHACIAPGSRNLPITEALLDSPIKCYSYIDERSMCYFANGISKVTNKPIAVVTTSGTATANLLPGIIEAKMSGTPLFIITADRPKRLISSGATQTIDQINLFGKYVNDMVDIEHSKEPIDKILKKLSNCINNSSSKSPGPIHINLRFDEPLYDNYKKIDFSFPEKTPINNNKENRLILENFKRPLIICGGINPKTEIKQILYLSKKMNAPIFVDIFSQMRHCLKNNVFLYYHQYLNSLNPDLILRFGYKPTSKSLNDFIIRHHKKTILINEHQIQNDDCPNKMTSSFNELKKCITVETKGEKEWMKTIIDLESYHSNSIKKHTAKNTQAALISQIFNKLNGQIFIGNSTLIRTFDEFSGNSSNPMKIFGNYITRGIDGIVSTALGMASTNNKKNNFLFIGDVSLMYDINGFQILKNEIINLTIIVINNKGGQIFNQLPYSNKKIKDFKKFWITEPKTRIKDVAKLFNIKYYKLNIDEILRDINKIANYTGVKIIEIKINHETELKTLNKIKEFQL